MAKPARQSPAPLGRTREELADHWVHTFANGLTVHTDPFMKPDGRRVLPIGGPQDCILNHLVANPHVVRGKRVFEPFAGSGIFGLMALQLGADHVDLLDVNPRAIAFARANAARNEFAEDRYTTHLQSIEDFDPAHRYDLILANPPFVPIPPGIEGSLSSAAGPEGTALSEMLLGRVADLLETDGQAFVYLMQFMSESGPLLAPSFGRCLRERTVAITRAQREPIALSVFADAYRRCFPNDHASIDRWQRSLTHRHGAVGLENQILHIHARGADAPPWCISDDLESKYGVEPYSAAQNEELAMARVFENVVPDA